MLSEPYKIKEVKSLVRLQPYERWNILKRADFNTFGVSSEHVSFDLVARGMSSWTHFQKAGLMIGDEAYAGSVNFFHLQKNLDKTLGIKRLVPCHNGIGAEKLLATTSIKPGQIVLHNRHRPSGLVTYNKGTNVDVTQDRAKEYAAPDRFGADVDLARAEQIIRKEGKDKIAYFHIETCPDGWNGQPISLANLKAVKELAKKHGIPLVLDISLVMENALWVLQSEKKGQGDLLAVARELIKTADIVLMDASQDCHSDVGGFISSPDDVLFERFLNQVVLFEGLHTYGGMTGRAMEVFAVGVEELAWTEFTEWYDKQIEDLYKLLTEKGVPAFRGTKGVALDVQRMLPHLKPTQHPKFVLAASLYILGGVRTKLDGDFAYHGSGDGQKTLTLELPRNAFTRDHLEEIASVVAAVHGHRDELYGLHLINEPKFVDEARFEPENQRLFVSFPEEKLVTASPFEPYKIAVVEPIKLVSREKRREMLEKSGYNTFLMDSAEVYIDLLTDSGTTAMSCYQWEGMTNSNDTPYTSRHFLEFVEEFREILGFEHIIPTHQGRAAEHIMSQVMIKPGQLVPGNMYFTTTREHQEMAGGKFVDIIIDEAHDAQSPHPWKGNIDLAKLQKCIDEVGGKGIAYISFEMSVNLAGGQPFSMQNLKDVSRLCQKHGIPIMFDATRCVENSYMIKLKDPEYAHKTVKEILREMMSYGDGCTVSCKKDFLVNMGGLLACNDDRLAEQFRAMLRVWEGDVTNGGLDTKDIVALHRGLLDSLDDDYIRNRIEQTQRLGGKLNQAGIPIVNPPGSHAIFVDARRFLPHLDQDEYPAQALAAAMYLETGVRVMERGNVSKGRDPKTGQNFRPKLELVRCTIPRRVYTNSHMDFVADGIIRLYEKRDRITGLEFTYEPKALRFFQSRFKPKAPWSF